MVVFILALLLVTLAFLGLGLNIFFTRNRTFPETEVGHNRHMKALGIHCTKCEEMRKWKTMQEKQRTFIIPSELGIDLSKF